MAGSLNRASIIGHLGGDPEIRDVSGGSRVANFSVATTESWMKDGEKRERTEWHRVVIWNDKLVDVVEKYVKKGDKVLIEGEMQTEKWFKRGDEETQENARYTTKIVLTGFNGKLLMLGSPGAGPARDPNDNASRPGNSSQGSSRAPAGGAAGGGSSRLDDDIPF